MLFLKRPTTETISAVLNSQARLDFSYSAVGATASTPPAGYDVDHTRIKLGEGERVFNSAKVALERWQHFNLGWVEACPGDSPIKEGQVVAMLARSFGIWWLNPCRIIAVLDEDGPVKRFGFAYGTLPDHVESGEERFLIEWHRTDSCVWYDILAFSRPRHILARLGYPWVRHLQKRFRQESAAAICRVATDTPEA
jgi:uncharacterized protein (UPF0548 family)